MMKARRVAEYLKQRRWMLAGLVLAGTALVPAIAQTPIQPTATTPMLTVGIKVAPPFVIEDAAAKGPSSQQRYRGLAIDVWKQAASENGWQYQFRHYDLNGLLDAVSNGEVDVGIGALTTTAQREQRMDFSHPLSSSGLAIAARSNQMAGWLAVVGALASPEFLKVIMLLTLVLVVVGLAAWLLERKHNPDQFGGSHAQGVFSGMWWAMVTMTTVGYGDVAPRTIGGRLLGMVWMLTALIIVSFFTASITSALTVGQLSSRIDSADDLAGMRVASVSGSTSAQWLQSREIAFVDTGSLERALQRLAGGTVDAVVYDAPLLHWQIQRHHADTLQVLPFILERQDYAFALPDASALSERINTSVLKQINAPQWNERVEAYLGSNH